ncbi:MAG: hypothetical protein KBD37_01635 [Burkholderiales bacterium]|nr:hypothetical protein [Burkholderiales bacterium]
MQNLVITPKLLHKDSQDDVLLSHPRFALPLYINENIAQRWVQAELEFLLELYLPHNGESDILCLNLQNGNQGLSSLFGRSIPVDVTWQRCRALPYQIIENEFSESHAPLLQKLEDFQNTASKTNQSMINLFCSTSYRMINQADHYFFYRKEHEHVPGIMLIEAQRQAVYAHIYVTTQHVQGEVTISLGRLNATFYGYVELMYSVELVVDTILENRDLRSEKNTYRVSFFQWSKLVAIIETEVEIIEMNQFQRLRNLFIYEKGGYWYKPIHTNKIQCTLIDSGNREYLVECISFSRNGCVTTCNNVAINEICMTKLKSNGFTFVSTVELENRLPKKVAWKFPNLSHDQLINMGGIIKRAFILQDKEVYQ